MSLALATIVRTLRPPEPTPRGAEDAALVEQCLAGERRAFDRLYRRHARSIHGRLVRLVGRSDDVEDLTQQVFLEAFRSLPKFRGEAAFGTWLHRIAVHVALGAIRRNRRKPLLAFAPGDIDAVATTEPTPEASAGARELYEIALRHLDGLKPDHRVAFVLRHVECLSLEQIGQLVGAKAPAVGQRVKKAERVLIERIARAERNAARRREENCGTRVS